MKERNSLVIKNLDTIHGERYPSELYSDYIHQFRTELAKEINVDATAKEDDFNFFNDEINFYDTVKFFKRQRNPIKITSKWNKKY